MQSLNKLLLIIITTWVTYTIPTFTSIHSKIQTAVDVGFALNVVGVACALGAWVAVMYSVAGLTLLLSTMLLEGLLVVDVAIATATVLFGVTGCSCDVSTVEVRIALPLSLLLLLLLLPSLLLLLLPLMSLLVIIVVIIAAVGYTAGVVAGGVVRREVGASIEEDDVCVE